MKLRNLIDGYILALSLFATATVNNACAIDVSTTWTAADNGDWADAVNWTSALFPNNDTPNLGDTYDVRIDATGAPYKVVLNESVAINSLTLDSPDATLSLGNGQLSVPMIDLADGILVLSLESKIQFDSEVEIAGATIVGDMGQLVIDGGREALPVFNGVTLGVDTIVPSSGTSPPRTRLVVRNGLEFTGGSVLTVLDRDAQMQVDGTQTISGEGEIRFEQIADFFRSGTMRLSDDTTLTIGPDVVIRATNMGGSIGARRGTSGVNENLTLINNGLISGMAGDRQPLEILNVSRDLGAVFENHGVVEVLGEGTVVVGGDWNNDGLFRIRDNGLLTLNGQFRFVDLGTIDRQGGRLVIAGDVDNIGQTFTASAATGDIMVAGNVGDANLTRILGGTIAATDGATWQFGTSRLEDVTLATDISINSNVRTEIAGNLTLDGSKVSLSSSSGFSSHVTFAFIDDATPQAILGNGSVVFTEGRGDEIVIDNELTITPNIVLEATGGTGSIQKGRLVNQGVMQSSAEGGLNISADDFVNEGLVDLAGFSQIGGDDQAVWTNHGMIRTRDASIVRLGGQFTPQDIGNVQDDGAQEIAVVGVLDLTGQVYDLETWPFEGNIFLREGGIRDGTIVSSGDATIDFAPGSATEAELIDITIASDLVIPNGGRTLFVGDFTLDDAVIDIGGGQSWLFNDFEPQFIRGTGEIIVTDIRSFS
ncbi:MAG: hypothetical protein ACR2NU_10310, partial [Aeoliella sp.]